eukprot:SAG31_NODE_2959_length_4851_cov_5.415825_4_plen_50_part_01
MHTSTWNVRIVRRNDGKNGDLSVGRARAARGPRTKFTAVLVEIVCAAVRV